MKDLLRFDGELLDGWYTDNMRVYDGYAMDEDTGEVIDLDEEEPWEEDDDDDYEPYDIDNDMGYDPYMGCYTDDC